MGIRSYTCAKTNLPIIVYGESQFRGKDLAAVLFFPAPGKAPIPGRLGQYDTFQSDRGEIDLWKSGYATKIENGEAKFALKDFLDPGDSYETIGRSHNDPGQGGLTYDDWFLDQAVKAGGFRSILGLNLSHTGDVPLEIARDIDDKAAELYDLFVKDIAAGWERGTLDLIPGNPQIGIPGSIGRFFSGTVAPLDSECSEVMFRPYGDPRPKADLFVLIDDKFSPDPFAYARAKAFEQRIGRERAAVFEAADGRTYTVTTYGDDLYTVQGTDYPLTAFKQVDEALNTIGFDLPFPASLDHVDPEAGKFFSPWGSEEEKPDKATFSIPSPGRSPRI